MVPLPSKILWAGSNGFSRKNKKDIKAIDLKIQNEALIVSFLENIYKNISFATNDIKNLVELMKLETQ